MLFYYFVLFCITQCCFKYQQSVTNNTNSTITSVMLHLFNSKAFYTFLICQKKKYFQKRVKSELTITIVQ